MTLLGVGAAWLGALVQSAHRQERAVDALDAETDADVSYEYDVDASGKFAPGGRPPVPAWLRRLLGRDFFCTVVAVTGDDLGDRHMQYIKSFPYLRERAVGNNVSDDGLAHERFPSVSTSSM